jgi:hypothetical protein
LISPVDRPTCSAQQKSATIQNLPFFARLAAFRPSLDGHSTGNHREGSFAEDKLLVVALFTFEQALEQQQITGTGQAYPERDCTRQCR